MLNHILICQYNQPDNQGSRIFFFFDNVKTLKQMAYVLQLDIQIIKYIQQCFFNEIYRHGGHFLTFSFRECVKQTLNMCPLRYGVLWNKKN